MFPGVDGFHWTVGHVIFISLFIAVAFTIVGTVLRALIHSARALSGHRAIEFCWRANFAELPVAERRCRHELAGRVISRTCDHEFDCRGCENYPHFAVLPATGHTQDLGLDYPADRLYHRGHTWLKPQDDGTVTIGLDALADHLIGKPDSVRMLAPGDGLEVNQIAWRFKKNGHEIHVRAPLEGTILSVGGEYGWTLTLRPRVDLKDARSLRHLLRGPEVHGWIVRELERLQLQLRPAGTQASLADGGVLVHGLMDAAPSSDWDTVIADTFLEG